MKAGKYTREYLEAEGLILPSRRNHRGETSAWTKAVAVKAVKRTAVKR